MNISNLSTVSQKTVLLADSDHENRILLREALLLRGFAVYEAESLRETTESLASHSVQAIIIDLELSSSERAELVSRIQAEEFGKVALFLLMASSAMTREDAYDLGAAAALSKPVEPSDLIARLERALVPPSVRWKKGQAKHPRHQVALSLDHLALGRGGFTLNNEPNHQIFEGERVAFNVEVNEHHPWRLQGTGIVRYVKLDQKNRRQKAWGIEFESIDESSFEKVIGTIERGKPVSYIPRIS